MDNMRSPINTCGCVRTVGQLNKSADREKLIAKMPRKRALAAEDPRIGTIHDADLARSLGISQTTVRLARQQLDMPRYKPYRGDCAEEILSQKDLGDVPDWVIAQRLDVAKSYVQRVRSRYGVSSTVGKNHGACHTYVEPENWRGKMMLGWGR